MKQRTRLFIIQSFSVIITLESKRYEETDKELISKDFLIIVNYRVNANEILTHDSRTRNILAVAKAKYCCHINTFWTFARTKTFEGREECGSVGIRVFKLALTCP